MSSVLLDRDAREEVFAHAVAISPDGMRFAASSPLGGASGLIPAPGEVGILWDTTDGRCLGKLHGVSDPKRIGALTFSPDGTRIAAVGEFIEVWDVETFRVELAIQGNLPDLRGALMNACAWSPDGTKLVAGGRQNAVVKVWDMTFTTDEIENPHHWATIRHCRFFPVGRRVVSGSDDGSVHVWDFERNLRLATLEHEWQISALAISPDGGTIASASQFNNWEYDYGDRNVTLWDAATYVELDRVCEVLTVAGCEFSPDGRYLLAVSSEKAFVDRPAVLGLCNLRSRRTQRMEGGYRGSFSPDGKRIVTTAKGNGLALWVHSGWLRALGFMRRLSLEAADWPCAFSPDSRILVSGCHAINSWETQTQRLEFAKLVELIEGRSAEGPAQPPTGPGVFALRLWDASTGVEHSYRCRATAFL